MEVKTYFRRATDLPREELFGPGHRLCAGCGPAIAVRLALKAIRKPVIVVNATSCVEVASTPYPYTAWAVPWVHVLFENTAAVASGIVETLDKLVKEGRAEDADVIAIGGDGGTFDIGLQALSGALERGHKFLYICLDNEAYMNTGIQRSGATPRGAETTTSFAGKVIPGKLEYKKDLASIVVAHAVPYVATASIGYWLDYVNKVRRALETDGPSFIHVLTPCQTGWRFDASKTVEIGKLAVETKIFPLYEVINGVYRINVKPKSFKPIEEYLKLQGRFKHLFEPQNRHIIDEIQQQVDARWKRLLVLEEASQRW
ncbi:MAG TPA: pyruvate synthase subunit beta [Candidatus Bathyarchaeota archaeon]|nr:pyruvate synthase subunit beta [Candidatus Bathyarchaeota archaeon]